MPFHMKLSKIPKLLNFCGAFFVFYILFVSCGRFTPGQKLNCKRNKHVPFIWNFRNILNLPYFWRAFFLYIFSSCGHSPLAKISILIFNLTMSYYSYFNGKQTRTSAICGQVIFCSNKSGFESLIQDWF